MDVLKADVVVVGAGNAALCAALAAVEQHASVIVLERAPESLRGGNSAFTAGSMRVAHRGPDDIRKLVADLSDEELANSDFGSYPSEQFFDDVARLGVSG
jgi:tricarballylate dehydrogenase